MSECRYRLSGEVDLAVTVQIRSDLRRVIAANDECVIVDCTDLTFIDSSGIAILLELHRDLAREGRELRIVNVDGAPRQTFRWLGLTDLVHDGQESVSPGADS